VACCFAQQLSKEDSVPCESAICRSFSARECPSGIPTLHECCPDDTELVGWAVMRILLEIDANVGRLMLYFMA
jgi:hypothetical protein